MHGTFNSVRLRRITSIATVRDKDGRSVTTFRVLGFRPPDLETQLQPNTPALLILSDSEIEGRIFRYRHDEHGYEIRLEPPRLPRSNVMTK